MKSNRLAVKAVAANGKELEFDPIGHEMRSRAWPSGIAMRR
jgi:hypothetical protein